MSTCASCSYSEMAVLPDVDGLDAPVRSKAEVLEVFDRAIATATEDGR